MGLSDTHPRAAHVQFSLLRQAPPSRKFALVRSLTRTAVRLSLRALRRANPHLTEREADLLFVARSYGQDLADRVQAYLDPNVP
jgi:hypothetical protein